MVATPEDAFALCEALAEDRTRATGVGSFADGYRAAAEELRDAIRAKRTGRARTVLEVAIRDAEIESRTLADVVRASEEILAELGGEATAQAALAKLLDRYFVMDDLPESLRARLTSAASGPRLVRRPR